MFAREARFIAWLCLVLTSCFAEAYPRGAEGSSSTGQAAATGVSGATQPSGAPSSNPNGSTSGTSPGSATPPPSLLSSVSFENATTGDWQIVAGNSNSEIVMGHAAHGNYALRLVAGSNYNDAAFLVNSRLFPLAVNSFNLRFYINLGIPLGQNHTTLALASGSAQNSEVRLGGQFNILVENIASNDALRISADNFNGFPNGTALTVNTWYCVEMLFDGVHQTLRTWVNDVEIKNLAVTQPTDWTSSPGSNWMPTFSQVKVGWQSYGAGTGNTVYVDDVAVGSQHIGCMP